VQAAEAAEAAAAAKKALKSKSGAAHRFLACLPGCAARAARVCSRLMLASHLAFLHMVVRTLGERIRG